MAILNLRLYLNLRNRGIFSQLTVISNKMIPMSNLSI